MLWVNLMLLKALSGSRHEASKSISKRIAKNFFKLFIYVQIWIAFLPLNEIEMEK